MGKKEARRLGKEAEAARVDAKDMYENKQCMEAIVLKNVVSGANSLSQVEWQQMEGAMPPDEKTTHQNLAAWMIERANSLNIVEEKEEEDDADEMAKLLGEEALEGEGADDDSDDDAEEEKKPKDDEQEKKPASGSKDDKGESKKAAADKGKNWSAVNVVYKEIKH